jgi:hypothetical protein
MLKICNKCQTEKPVADFYANKRMKDGLNTFCIACHKADNVARKAKNRADTAFCKAEMEYKKAYRSGTVERRAMYMTAWRQQNQDSVAIYAKTYRAANKEKYNFLCQKRKIDIINRTPAWLTDDDLWMIEQAYALAGLRTAMTGIKWHVDHQIPLRGKTVSGFHTPLNLQVIPAAHNQRKSNKFEV